MPTDFAANLEAAALDPTTDSDAKVALRYVGRFFVLDLDGPLVLSRMSKELLDPVEALLAAGARDFVINLAGVPYVDSTGVGTLLACRLAILTAGGKIMLSSTSARVWDTLKRLRVNTLFEFSGKEVAA
jgi:anti-sigma B factor antagonist